MTVQEMYNKLAARLTPAGAAGVLGNWYVESKLQANNLQNSYNRKLGLSDEEYTAAVDNGTYKDFIRDQAGFGIGQWTSAGRKASLLKYAQDQGKSIGDCEMQLDYFLEDLQRYTGLYTTLTTTDNVKTASTQMCCLYERPASLGNPASAAATKLIRARYALKVYNLYGRGDTVATTKVKLGSASLGSNGRAKGDKPGDQGNEVRICDWYRAKLGWILIRPKDSTKASIIADCMRALCENQNIGYNQEYHDKGFEILKAAGALSLEGIKGYTGKVDTDCSGSVRICLACAGIEVPTFRTKNEATILSKTGLFAVYTDSKYTTQSDYLRKGDILCTKTAGHTVIVLNDGPKAEETHNYKTLVSQGILYKDKTCKTELAIVYAGNVVEDFGKTTDGKLHGIKFSGMKGYIASACFGYVTAKEAPLYVKPGVGIVAVVPADEQVEYYGVSPSDPNYIAVKWHTQRLTYKGYMHKEAFDQ